MMARRPGITAVLVFTLALGIGANSAIFSVVDGVLLRSLPYEKPDELVNLYEYNFARGHSRFSVSFHNFTDWRNQSEHFDDMAAYNTLAANLTGGAEPRRVVYADVSHNLFQLLRVAPILGRSFLPDDAEKGQNTVVLLSHRFWQDYFGGDTSIIDETIQLHGRSFIVVGIMPPSFEFPSPEVELWRPFLSDPNLFPGDRSRHFARAIGRLKTGVTIEQAQMELDTIAGRLAVAYPKLNEGWAVSVESLHESMVSNSRAVLLILWAAVGLVMLIACSNVANILFAQAASREKEIAIRSALGAGRFRIVCQTLAETVLLALLSGAAGVMLAFWGVTWLPKLAGDSLPNLNNVALDWRIMALTALAAVVTGILIGIVPAVQASKTDMNASLKESGRSSASGPRSRFRDLLVVSEVALALVLLISATLVILSFANLWSAESGFNPKNVLTFRYSLPISAYPQKEQMSTFHHELTARLESLAEVESASVISVLPLGGDHEIWSFSIEGRPADDTENANTMVRHISPGHLRNMRIPLLKGRAFTNFDRAGGENTMIISNAMASTYWPAEDPIGKHLRFGGPPALKALTWRIVGVAEDVPSSGLDVAPRPTVYVPQDQWPWHMSSMSLALRAKPDPDAIVNSVRAEIASLDKDLPIFDLKTMDAIRGDAVAQRRFGMLLLGIFAGVALMLAVVGLYGTIAYMVGQRTREIGIRIAMGAQKHHILTMTVGHGFVLTATGMLAGLGGAHALTRYLSSLLFGISGTDGSTFIAVSVLLLAVAMLASYMPARRAARIEPVTALYYE
jgi:putative ABC transport system permease protein